MNEPKKESHWDELVNELGVEVPEDARVVPKQEPVAEEPQPTEPTGAQIEKPQIEKPQPKKPQSEKPQSETPQIETPQIEKPQIEKPQIEKPQPETPQPAKPQRNHWQNLAGSLGLSVPEPEPEPEPERCEESMAPAEPPSPSESDAPTAATASTEAPIAEPHGAESPREPRSAAPRHDASRSSRRGKRRRPEIDDDAPLFAPLSENSDFSEAKPAESVHPETKEVDAEKAEETPEEEVRFAPQQPSRREGFWRAFDAVVRGRSRTSEPESTSPVSDEPTASTKPTEAEAVDEAPFGSDELLDPLAAEEPSEEGQGQVSSEPGGEQQEGAPRRRRRRGRRGGRRRRTSSDPARSEGGESTQDQTTTAASPVDEPQQAELDDPVVVAADQTEASCDEPSRPPRRSSRRSTEEAAGEPDAEARPRRERKFPSWEDAVTLIVDRNLAAHKESGGGRGSRPRRPGRRRPSN